MAVYKPTDCAPFLTTVDLFQVSQYVTAAPIWLECKIDTSNIQVTGFSIEVYDDENNKIFPVISPSYTENNFITYIDDLYHNAMHNDNTQALDGYVNVNSGLNGTFLKIPFFINEHPDVVNQDTHRYNQIWRTYDSGSNAYIYKDYDNHTVNIQNGQTYKWCITLYQNVTLNSARTHVVTPTDPIKYDMNLTSGTVLGSTKKRIQTNPSDKILIDYFLQPVTITDLSITDPDTWTGTAATNIGNRVRITDYDYSYGHIYLQEGSEGITQGSISPDSINGFQIYKYANNTTDLTAYRKVEYWMDGECVWDSWEPNLSTPGLSAGISYYDSSIYNTSDGKYYPFKDLSTPYKSMGMESGQTRVILSNITVAGATSLQYCGIYIPTFSKVTGEDRYQCNWVRSPDADTWGELLYKTVVVTGSIGNHTNENIQCVKHGHENDSYINENDYEGSLNTTQLGFAVEKPIQLYTSSDTLHACTGLVLHNTSMVDSGNYKTIFIRPYTGLQAGMLWQQTGSSGSLRSFIISEVNTKYWYIKTTDAIVNTSQTYPFTTDTTKYNIKSYFRKSDENTFYTYTTPTATITVAPLSESTSITFPEIGNSLENIGVAVQYICDNYSQFMPDALTPYENPEAVSDCQVGDYIYCKSPEAGQTTLWRVTSAGSTWPTTTSYQITNLSTSDIEGLVKNKTILVDTRNILCKAEFAQAQNIGWKNYQWFLYNSEGVLIDKTSVGYDGNIEAKFYGLIGMTVHKTNPYSIKLVIETQMGQVVTYTYNICCSFSEEAASVSYGTAYVPLDCDRLAAHHIATRTNITMPDNFVVDGSKVVYTSDHNIPTYTNDGYVQSSSPIVYSTVMANKDSTSSNNLVVDLDNGFSLQASQRLSRLANSTLNLFDTNLVRVQSGDYYYEIAMPDMVVQSTKYGTNILNSVRNQLIWSASYGNHAANSTQSERTVRTYVDGEYQDLSLYSTDNYITVPTYQPNGYTGYNVSSEYTGYLSDICEITQDENDASLYSYFCSINQSALQGYVTSQIITAGQYAEIMAAGKYSNLSSAVKSIENINTLWNQTCASYLSTGRYMDLDGEYNNYDYTVSGTDYDAKLILHPFVQYALLDDYKAALLVEDSSIVSGDLAIEVESGSPTLWNDGTFAIEDTCIGSTGTSTVWKNQNVIDVGITWKWYDIESYDYHDQILFWKDGDPTTSTAGETIIRGQVSINGVVKETQQTQYAGPAEYDTLLLYPQSPINETCPERESLAETQIKMAVLLDSHLIHKQGTYPCAWIGR